MRELNVLGKGRLAWIDRPDPVVEQPTDAVVRPFVVARCEFDCVPIHHHVTRAAQIGLKIGLMDAAWGHVLGPAPFVGPLAIGHECIAEVVDVGPSVEGLRIGDRVVVPWAVSCGHCANCARGLTAKCLTTRCADGPQRALSAYGIGKAAGRYGGMASDLLRVPHAGHMLVKLPTGLDPLRVAGASDTLSDGWRAVVPQLAAHPGGATVLVVGGLALANGLYAAGLAVAHGAAAVDYADHNVRNLEIAESFGARAVERAPWSTTPADRYDIVVDASSTPYGARYAIHATAPGGVCTVLGMLPTRNAGIPLMHMWNTDITLHVGLGHTRRYIPELLDWIHTNDFPAEKVLTSVADFEDAPTAYAQRTTKLVLQRDTLA
ncbi:zinc-dependent alcohol dehydrogenase [Nocardia brasiliensis]